MLTSQTADMPRPRSSVVLSYTSARRFARGFRSLRSRALTHFNPRHNRRRQCRRDGVGSAAVIAEGSGGCMKLPYGEIIPFFDPRYDPKKGSSWFSAGRAWRDSLNLQQSTSTSYDRNWT